METLPKDQYESDKYRFHLMEAQYDLLSRLMDEFHNWKEASPQDETAKKAWQLVYDRQMDLSRKMERLAKRYYGTQQSLNYDGYSELDIAP
jgi:hypothetical protein